MKFINFTKILLISLLPIFMVSCGNHDDDLLEGDLVSKELRNVIENGDFEFIALRRETSAFCSVDFSIRDEIRNVRFEGIYITFDDFTFNLSKLISYCDSGSDLVLDFED